MLIFRHEILIFNECLILSTAVRNLHIYEFKSVVPLNSTLMVLLRTVCHDSKDKISLQMTCVKLMLSYYNPSHASPIYYGK